MTKLEIFDVLAYAGIAQQTEVTAATVEVYFDQLGRYNAVEMQRAVRQWVSECSDEFRRLPTVTELKVIVNRSKPRLDPEVARVMRLNAAVDQARKSGKTQLEIDEIIEFFELKSVVS